MDEPFNIEHLSPKEAFIWVDNFLAPRLVGKTFNEYELWKQEYMLVRAFYMAIMNGNFAHFITDNTVAHLTGTLKAAFKKINARRAQVLLIQAEQAFPQKTIPEDETERMETFFLLDQSGASQIFRDLAHDYVVDGENLNYSFFCYAINNKFVKLRNLRCHH